MNISLLSLLISEMMRWVLRDDSDLFSDRVGAPMRQSGLVPHLWPVISKANSMEEGVIGVDVTSDGIRVEGDEDNVADIDGYNL
jgi:hypothetical protein